MVLGDGDEGLVDVWVAEAESFEDKRFMVGSSGGGEGYSRELVEGYGSNGGGDGGDVWCGGVGAVWWRRIKDVDFEGRLTGEYELAQFHHGNQVPDLGRRVEDYGFFHDVGNLEMTKVSSINLTNPPTIQRLDGVGSLIWKRKF